MNSAAKPTSPSTPAPADALLIARVALLTIGMNSEESSDLSPDLSPELFGFRFAIDCAFLEIALLRVHPFDVGRVVSDRVGHRDPGGDEQRGDRSCHRGPAREHAAAIDDRFGEELRKPGEPGADRARWPGTRIGDLGEEARRDLVQARRT